MNQDIPHKRSISEHWLYWTFVSPDLLKKPLQTTDNKLIRIIDPGRLNYDNGPDILNAILQIDGCFEKGDIEFHINPDDWFKHGHNEDRRYHNIILHVLWEIPNNIHPSLLRRFPHLKLHDQIGVSFGEWCEKMDLLEQLESVQFKKLPELNSITLSQIKDCGRKRFSRKVERYKYWLEQYSFDDILVISLAEALGYSKNRFPFRQLLWENPPSKIFQAIPRLFCSPLGIWVYLSIKANFLTTRSFSHLRKNNTPTIAKIEPIFCFLTDQGMVPDLQLKDWYFSRVRPANNPIIRLAALAHIIHQYHSPSLFKCLLQSAIDRFDFKQLIQVWETNLQLPFQKEFFDAMQILYRLPIPSRRIIGTRRIHQFIINCLLPLLYLWAERSNNYGFQQYVEGIYEQFPACEDTRVLEQFTDQFLGSEVDQLAIYQQGVFELIAEKQTDNQTLFQLNN